MRNLEDSVKPVYEFEWENGRTRRTDEFERGHHIGEAGVGVLAELGADDPECTVQKVGYES